MDFTILKKAGITIQDFKTISGVSALTIIRLTKGRKLRRKEFLVEGFPIGERLETGLRILEKLVASGKLPVRDLPTQGRMHPEQRAKRLRIVAKIKEHVDHHLAQQHANA